MCGSCYNTWLIDKDPEKKAQILAKKRQQWAVRYSARNSEEHSKKHKNRALRHRYGIDLAEYERLHEVQGNRCAICNAEGGNTRSTRLYVDHNHSTGAVRQLLCPGCNQALGIIEQGVERIKELTAYLAKHDPSNEAWNALAKLDLMIREREEKQTQ